MNNISYEIALAVAKIIGHCDFRVTLSQYVNRDGSPWIITVGEWNWQRHLVLEEAWMAMSGGHAKLAILSQEESAKFGYDIRTNNIVERIMLSELVAGKYIGVKKALYPQKREVATQPR